jgi:predicted oxidoreductase
MSTTYASDTLVLGGGLAGLATVLELLDAGKRVLLLDRATPDRLGGLARISFGGVFSVDSPEQRRSGVQDSPELALADWLAFGEIKEEDVWPRRWAEAFVGRCRPEVRDWLVARGVKFLPVVNWVERGLYQPGNSVPRFHIVWGTGYGLILALVAAIEAHPHRAKLEIRYRHKVEELTSQGGHIVGCTGIDEETGASFTATASAVVVASGGIAGDLERVRRHWYKPWGEPPEVLLNGSHPEADGKLQDAAEAHGAQVTHLEKMWNYAAGVHHWKPTHAHHGLSLVPPKSALWVDAHGKRLGPPPLVTAFDTRYLVETIAQQPRKYSWQIMNMKIAKKELAVSGSEFNHAIRDKSYPRFFASVLFGNKALVDDFIANCPDFVTANSVPELVAKMNERNGDDAVDADVLGAEIAAYDGQIARGASLFNDDQLRRIASARQYKGDRFRTCKFARIDDPDNRPLIAVREFILTRKSLGGIQTDLDSRVLDASGEPIPGLWAVGEAAGFGGGGMHGLRALEGTFIGGCIFSGRIAGRSIAKG